MPFVATGRAAYAEEIRQLEHDLLEMGTLADAMVGDAVDALARLDSGLAYDVLLRDDEVDRRELEIESRCLRLLALQQPIGSDLREVGTVLKVITDIERVGDLAVDLARIALKIEKEFGDPTLIDIPRMAKAARQMLRGALEAFVRRDEEMVKDVCARDEAVDGMYRDLREQIFRDLRQGAEAAVADGWLLLAVHHVERIADHAVNIAERVQFMLTGEMRQFGTTVR